MLRTLINGTVKSLFLILFPALALSENINGTWAFVSLYGGTPYNYSMTFSATNGVITGTGGGNSGWTISGTITGNQVSWAEDYIGSSYVANRVGTISGDTMSGTWSSNASQNGTWTATRTSGGGGTGGGDGDGDGNSTGKRPTGIQLFCNRTGVNLETAVCTAAVADKGPQPVTTPTGTVEFTSTDGFFPATASCAILQTPLSPGIASCQAQFAVPFGFTIGAKFPINVAYSGDTNFEASATEHKLITASCIGTPTKPCPSSVGLAFADIPQILKNAIEVVISCAESKKSLLAPVALAVTTKPKMCEIVGTSDIELADVILESINGRSDIEGFKAFCRAIPSTLAAKDQLLRNLKLSASADDKVIRDALRSRAGLIDLISNGPPATRRPVQFGSSASELRVIARKNPTNLYVSVGTLDVDVKSNSQKKVGIKLNAAGKRYVQLFKKVGRTDLPFRLKVQSLTPGAKKPKSATVTFDAQLN